MYKIAHYSSVWTHLLSVQRQERSIVASPPEAAEKLQAELWKRRKGGGSEGGGTNLSYVWRRGASG